MLSLFSLFSCSQIQCILSSSVYEVKIATFHFFFVICFTSIQGKVFKASLFPQKQELMKGMTILLQMQRAFFLLVSLHSTLLRTCLVNRSPSILLEYGPFLLLCLGEIYCSKRSDNKRRKALDSFFIGQVRVRDTELS